MNKTSGLQICITSLLQNCKSLTSLKQIHAYACKTNLLTDSFIAGKFLLICTSVLTHALHYAFGIFRQIPDPDIFMYNTLIRGQSESEAPEDAVLTYVEIRRKGKLLGISPDSFSFAFVLKAASRFGSLRLGIQLHSEALRHGLNTHLFVATTLVSMYGECGSLNNAKTAFAEMRQPNVVAWNAMLNAYFSCGDVKGAEVICGKMGLQNLTSWNIMLAGYMKAGEIELARELFGVMVIKDDVSWSTMIIGFAHGGCFEEAFWCFRELVKVGIRPNEVSLTGVLTACAQSGAFEFGKIVHGLIEKAGFNRIVSVNNALLDAYCRCGNVGMAQLVFESIVGEKNVLSWTSMLAGLAMYGLVEEAIRLFHLMGESGVRPDGITFISILYACSHAGLTELGCQYFHDMKERYGIEPAIEHYGCMVDLYGRAGQLETAYEFVIEMPIPPTDVIWRTLLGACSIHGNVALAERVKERLYELDPENSGDHVLLSNVYAVAGKWKDAATIRRSMTRRGIKKEPGWSVIEVNKTMYSFVAGVRENEASTAEAYEKLKEIMVQLRVQGGYFPETRNVLQDIEDEDKENAVTTHSEKLAVAFGMARLCKGSIIRIVKNLRICKDCHTVMKLISKVYSMQIVVRDRSRFHSFKDGVCSCSDFW